MDAHCAALLLSAQMSMHSRATGHPVPKRPVTEQGSDTESPPTAPSLELRQVRRSCCAQPRWLPVVKDRHGGMNAVDIAAYLLMHRWVREGRDMIATKVATVFRPQRLLNCLSLPIPLFAMQIAVPELVLTARLCEQPLFWWQAQTSSLEQSDLQATNYLWAEMPRFHQLHLVPASKVVCIAWHIQLQYS